MKYLLVVSLVVLLSSGACRKQIVEPEGGCEYTATIPLFSQTYTYRFDPASRLTYMLYTNGNKNFTDYVYSYQGRQARIEVTYQQNSLAKSWYELTLNEQGYVVTAQKTTRTTYTGMAEERIDYTRLFGYDAEGRLTTQRADLFTYPVGKPKQTQTYQQQLIYQDGNPVRISYTYETDYTTAKRSGTAINQYGTQANRLKIPLQLEVNLNDGFEVDEALLPLLGKPPRALLTRSKIDRAGAFPALDSIRYDYQLDLNGQVVRATLQPGQPNSYAYYPKVLLLATHCP